MIRYATAGMAKAACAVGPLAAVTAAALILLHFPPEQSGFYPRCPFYAAFHLQCPGCGGTRALAALLHGHPDVAMHDNLLITLLLPLALVYGIVCYRRWLQSGEMRWPQVPVGITSFLAIAAAVFTVLRNLP